MNKPQFLAPVEDACLATDDDRRVGERFYTVWRIAKVLHDGDCGLWRVSNISDGGMMLVAAVPVKVGDRLEIALSETIMFPAGVVWSYPGRCGVAFDAEVNGADVLRQLAVEQQSDYYRAPRLPLRTHAQMVTEKETRGIELVDMSQSGAGFVQAGHLEVGQQLDLLLTGGVRRKAIVRWSRGGRGGLWLTEPLDRADLESIRRLEG